MKNQEKQRKIYIRNTKQWVPVEEEIYLEYYRPVWRAQKAARKVGQCICPKAMIWVCDADCAMCEYQTAGNSVSLDAPLKNVEGDEITLGDTIADPDADFTDILADRLLIDRLLDELAEDSEDKRICELIMEGSSKTEMAATLQREFGGNWYKSKVVSHEKQVLDQLHKSLTGLK